MASPAWLPQEGQPSTSHAPALNASIGGSSAGPSTTVFASPAGNYQSMGRNDMESDSTLDSPKPVIASVPNHVISPPSFSYNVLPSVSTASGISQQPASSPVIRPNTPALPAFLQPLVPGQSQGVGQSLPGNTQCAGVSFSHGQHFQPTMPIVSPHSKGERNITPSLQPPLPGLLARPTSFTRGTTTNIISPLASSPSINLQQNLTTDASNKIDPVPSSSSASKPANTTSAHELLVSNTKLHPSTLWVPGTPLQGVSGMPSSSVSLVPPGVNPVQLPHMTIPSAPVDSSSAIQRPIIPTAPFPPNLAVQSQTYSVPPAGPPRGPWFQTPYVGGLPRAPFVPYASAVSGHFVSQPLGVSPGSAILPDHRPPSVSFEGAPAELAASSNPVNSSVISSGVQSELPSGIGTSINAADSAAREHLDAWTAHRTGTGAVYYYNALTKESTYERPSGFNGEAERVTAQPIPISMEKLDGTDWALVTTNDGKKYYYNSITKLSSWQVPPEVAEVKKKPDLDVVREQSISTYNSNSSMEKGPASVSLSAPAINTGGRDAVALRASVVPGSSSALDLIKKKLQDSGAPATTSSVPTLSGMMSSESNGSRAVEATVKGPHSENGKDKPMDVDDGNGNLSDTSSDSEGEDSEPTKEERIIQFRGMLKERGVAPFSKWEKELPKILFDPRFKAIPNHSARRAIFEHYVRTRAEEERKEKRAAQKAAIEGFKQLLDEAKEDIDHNTDYQALKKKWGHDPRFEALDRKDREVLLTERVIPLKKAAEERVQALRAAAASSFKSMLQERGVISVNTRWSKIKDGLRDDPRYRSVKHEDRESLFNECIQELKAPKEEAERVVKSNPEEEKLKERERALRKRKEREEQEVERVRLKARRKEAVESYQALLVETIKDPQASWTDSKSKLEKDPQARAANTYLDESDLEKFFREHVKILQERRVAEFRALLAEVITAEAAAQETEDGKTVLTSWSTAKRFLKSDLRYTKMPRKDRESLWCRYVDDLQRRQKSAADKEVERHRDARNRSSNDTGKYLSESRRNQ